MQEIYPDAFIIENVFFGCNNTTNIIELVDNKLVFKSKSGYFSSDRKVCKKEIMPKEEEWSEFWDKLDEIDAWNWKEDYDFDRSEIIADCDVSNIIITLEDKNIATRCHCNAPEGLTEFYEALNKLTKLDIQDPNALRT